MKDNDDLMERMNAFFNMFLDAPHEGQWELAERVIAEEPELFDSETVFEVTNSLFGHAIAAGETARFERLLDQIEEVVPEAYEAELHYMSEWRIYLALLAEDDVRLADVFNRFSVQADKHLDIYFQMVSLLGYMGKQEILYTGMRQGWASVKGSSEVLDWSQGEFSEKLGALELMQLLDAQPDLAADDPLLQERFAEYGLTIKPEPFAEVLDYRTGRKVGDWTVDEIKIGSGKKKTAAHKNFDFLLAAFLRYAYEEEGVARTKSEMGIDNVARYLRQRGAGEFKQSERGGRRKPTRKKKRSSKISREVDFLCPDPGTLVGGFEYHMSFMYTQYYEILAMFEMVPVWFRFLVTMGLLDESEMKKRLQDLGSVKGYIGQLLERFTAVPAVEKNLQAWPETAG